MYNRLPPELIQLIYQFDPTFSQIYSKIIPQLQCKRHYYIDGTIQREYRLNEDGNFHGKFIHYYKQNISKEINYKNGKLHGLSKEYHLNGVFKTQMMYKDGIMVSSVVKRFFDNGNLFSETRYKNEKRNGVCKMYHKNGMLREQIFYKNNKR